MIETTAENAMGYTYQQDTNERSFPSSKVDGVTAGICHAIENGVEVDPYRSIC